MKYTFNYLMRLGCFLMIIFLSESVLGQNNWTLMGVVKNDKQYPMQGVLVTIQEATVTAETDENGYFRIPVATNEKLTFSYLGFKTETRVMKDDVDFLEVVMAELPYGMTEDDLISVAFAKQNKKDLTSSVSSVAYDEISKRQDMNMMNGLGGLLNGLVVSSVTWADTNSDPTFYIRGLKTTSSNNSPLILVDNVERTFSQFNPREIESITVLKDAAALAIYGSRGANGVILVTTKRGKSNKRDVIINAQVGISQAIKMPEYLNSYDYALLYNKALDLDGKSPKYSDEAIQGYKKVVDGDPDANPYLYPNNDFIGNYLNKEVLQQQYDLTMTGGNDIAQYYVLLGYMNQEGIYKYGKNTFNRFNFRSNLDIRVFSKLTTSVDLAGRVENLAVPGGNYSYSMFGNFASTPSNAYPIFNPDGSLGGTTKFANNPYGLMNNMGQRDQSQRFFDASVSFKLDLSDITKGLSWTARGAFDFRDGFTEELRTDMFAVYNCSFDEAKGEYVYSKINKDKPKEKNAWYSMKDRQFTLYTSLNYDRSWKDHRVNAFALFNMREQSSMGVSVPYKNVGFAAQAKYAFKDRYLVEGTLGYTGSTNFARGNRFGLFPAISGGWIVSDEGFFPKDSFLSFLKLRASYGVTGLDNPTDERFLYRENWGASGGYSFGTSPVYKAGSSQLRLGNDDLKWETSYKTNVGVDLGFFKNSLRLTIDGFYDYRTDILVQRYSMVSGIAGLPLPYENAGKAKSYGFDAELSYSKQLNKNFYLNLSGNFMLTRSEVIDIAETYKLDEYQYQKGNPIQQPFGYVSDGLFKEEEIADYPIVQNSGNIRAGDIKYKDLNGDNIIDGRDTRPIGGSDIPNIVFGLNIDMKYKDFDLAIQMSGVADRWLYMPDIYMNNFSGDQSNATRYAFDAWTPETASTAKYPRLSVNDNNNNRQYSDFWFINGSFLRLKALEIGYSIPSRLINKIGIAKTRVYVNGYNLLCFSKNEDFDIEYPNAARWAYPQKRIYTLGLNVTF